MIASLLIANRGEIACRIIRTARAMGLRTVAVYSDADAKALHVRQADQAVHIGPSPAAESYLRGDKIIAAALETGAEAIHPGYGFLSENAEFAEDVIAAGLVWVGATPASIRAMGLKDAAKQLMRKAGVPVTPGYDGEDQAPERLKSEAETIGYPVLIKAVAGGGGKGMRKVDAPEDFLEALESCKREANLSFGNSDVLLEKWITSPRHIEVQVFGDTHGNVVHLFERDCSLQRRHQKVIEEAPAPGMDPPTREAICGAAVRAAKGVAYVGAGTIEFIADASEGLRADRVFFMEMNTRLQVEHPVTEKITGVDLVEWQLRVASGEPLPKRQDELSITGWAMEARLYAEDPAKGFLPSTGGLHNFILPDDVRVDTGVEDEDEVTPYYDPMIAKLIAHDATRQAALRRLADACGKVEVQPVRTNAWFLKRLLDDSEVQAGTVHTGLIAEKSDVLSARPVPSDLGLQIAASSLGNDLVGGVRGNLPFEMIRRMRGFRLNQDPESRYRVIVDGESRTVFVDNTDEELVTESWRRKTQLYGDQEVTIFEDGAYFQVGLDEPRGSGQVSAADGAIRSPMPGKVIAVDVTEGEAVTKGQRLMVLEAMKMEHALTAPFDGTVVDLAVHEGAQVQVEALLARVEKADS